MMPAPPPTCSELRAKRQANKSSFSLEMNWRVRGAIHWTCYPEDVKSDDCIRFLSLWLAIDTACEVSNSSLYKDEREQRNVYLEKMVSLDRERIHCMLWENSREPESVWSVMTNPTVFKTYWKNHHFAGKDWKPIFQGKQHDFDVALKRNDTAEVLKIVFERLYVLRLVHGSAKWREETSFPQVEEGVAILGFMVPIFIDLMLDNPYPYPNDHDRGWGDIRYSVLREAKRPSAEPEANQ